MDAPIAKVTLIGKRAGEEAFEITAEIGTPYKFGEDPEEWACPVSLTPLYMRLPDAHGGNSLQALCLAISLIQDLLQDFKDKGGVLTHDGNVDEFALDAYSFRPKSLK